jgi:sterol desaturase/sphingolipid hydroxylase (fatty acid hydroxylase superfamily)
VTLAWEALQQIGITLWHTLPWLAGLAIAFGVLSHFMPCNEGQTWWTKRGLMTDLGYMFLVPIFCRYLRIWLTVFLTIWIFHISDGQKIADFYLHGHGWLASLPLWEQGLIYLVGADFMYYWIHRTFHRGALWKYHAVHHAPQQIEWLSAYRWHPVNLMLGTAGVDVAWLPSLAP